MHSGDDMQATVVEVRRWGLLYDGEMLVDHTGSPALYTSKEEAERVVRTWPERRMPTIEELEAMFRRTI